MERLSVQFDFEMQATVDRMALSVFCGVPRNQVLIANNGMAGTKAILSMRQWCYLELGDEKAVEFVAMATPEVTRFSFGSGLV